MSTEPDLNAPVARQRLGRVLAVPLAGDPLSEGRLDGDPLPDDLLDGDPAGGDPAAAGVPLGGVPPGGVAARLAGAGAFDPGRRGLRALAALAVVVVLVAAGLAWWSRPQPEPVMPRLAATDAGPVPASPTEPAELVVAVSGMVHQPGLVRLPPGARVADAIEAAGGALPEADLDHLNLARKVTDGELIAVGIPPPLGEPVAGDQAGPGPKVNLNTATQAELETLPGIGPALAQRILDYRTEHGPFGAVGELRQVSGIGEVRFAELQDLVTV